MLTFEIDSMFSLPVFEHQLVMYVTADDKQTFSSPFDMSSIPVVTREQADAEDRTKKLTTATPTLKAPSTGPKKTAAVSGAESIASANAAAQKYVQQFSQVPEFQAYGAPLKSSPVIELTELETEFVVTAVKHIFKAHVVLQFDVKNTLTDTVCEDVSITSTPSEDDEEAVLEEDFIIPIARLALDQPGTAYVAFKKLSSDPTYATTSFTNTLKYTSKEIDPTTNEPEESGYEDEYQIEEIELNGSDYVVPTFAGSFSHVWEQVGAAGEEAEETLQLSTVKSIAGESGRFHRAEGHCSGTFPVGSVMLTVYFRCDGTTGKDTIATASRRHGPADQHQHTYAEAVRQDHRRGASGGAGQDGVLGQVWGDDEDLGAER